MLLHILSPDILFCYIVGQLKIKGLQSLFSAPFVFFLPT